MEKHKEFKRPVSGSQSIASTSNVIDTSKIGSKCDHYKSSSDISQFSDSRSDISSVGSIKPFSVSQIQDELDLKYNEYLRAKLINKIISSKMHDKKDILDRQTVQLASMNKELIDAKYQLEIQNEENVNSKPLIEKMNINSQLTDELLSILRKNCTNYKEILQYFTIISSQMPVNNVDLSEYNDEMFCSSLENINGLLRSISLNYTKRQVNRIKDVFEKIEVKDDQLSNLHKECLKQLNAAASNVIINNTNQLIEGNKCNNESDDST